MAGRPHFKNKSINLRCTHALRRDLHWAAALEGNFFAPFVRRVLTEAVARIKRQHRRDERDGVR
jgi:hypothetical protein